MMVVMVVGLGVSCFLDACRTPPPRAGTPVQWSPPRVLALARVEPEDRQAFDCASLPFRLRARRPVVPALREPAAAARAAAARSRRGLVRVGQRPTSKRARGLCALTLMVVAPETSAPLVRALLRPRAPRRRRRSPVTQLVLRRLRHLVDLAG